MLGLGKHGVPCHARDAIAKSPGLDTRWKCMLGHSMFWVWECVRLIMPVLGAFGADVCQPNTLESLRKLHLYIFLDLVFFLKKYIYKKFLIKSWFINK